MAIQPDVTIVIGTKFDQSLAMANKKLKGSFDIAALGVMFFGQSITRVTDAIYKSSSKMYQNIQHSIDGNVTAFDRFDTTLQKMQYSMATGIEPILANLVPMFNWFAGIIDDNADAFGNLGAQAALIGTVMGVGGALTLGLDSAITKLAAMNIKIIEITGGFLSLGKLFGVGLVLAAAYKIFSMPEGKSPTAFDWFQILGMSAAAGFIFGGVPGMFAAMSIAAVVTLSKEDAANFLYDAQKLRDAWRSVFEGTMTAKEALATGQWDRTIIPEAARQYEQQLLSNQNNQQPAIQQQYGNYLAPQINISSLVVSVDGTNIANGVSSTVYDTITSFG